MLKNISNFKKFILIGYIVAQIIEFQFNILVDQTYGNWIFTLIFYPIIMALMYPFYKAFEKIKNKKKGTILYYIFSIIAGVLVIEWSIIGTAPWMSEKHSAFIVQVGIVSFWAAVFFIPKIMLDKNKKIDPIKNNVTKFLKFYALITIPLGFLAPGAFKIIVIIWGEIIGYTFLHFYYYKYLKLQ